MAIDTEREESISTRVGDKLKARVAFVTGGTRGIGAAICRSLASQGATLAAGYAGNDDAAEKLPRRVRLHVPHAASASTRATWASRTTAAAPSTRSSPRTGGSTSSSTTPASPSTRPCSSMSDDDWFKVLNVNLSGAFFLSQAALRHMAERGSGRIVNVSSVIGEMGNIGQANYAASKSGLFGLTKTLAREAAFLLARSGKLTDPDGIGLTVNTVTPGFIATEMLEHVPAKVIEKILGQIPLGRLGKPEEIARVVHFLAADASSYVTGQVWGVNGGLDM